MQMNARLIPKEGGNSIYPFTLPDCPDFKELQWCLKAEESLCLVRICIGNYAAQNFDAPALTVFEEILSFFARHNKDIILRIIYDDEGKGMEHEPATLSQIQSHMNQLAVSFTNMLNISTLRRDFLSEAGEKCMIPDICHQSVSIECGTVCGSIWEMRYILLYVLRRSGEL